MQTTYVIDFDSTFVTLESLDELARIALVGHPKRLQIIEELCRLTDLGMEGKIGFAESLRQRLRLFQANRAHLQEVIELLRVSITPSVAENRAFFQDNAERIFIISGGFFDYIWPVVKPFGIPQDHVLANRFVFSAAGDIVGCDQDCLLAHDDGKSRQVAALHIEGPVCVIGDGYTDYQIKAAGQAQSFYAFTENISRPNVVAYADVVLSNLYDLISVKKVAELPQ